MKKKTFAYRLAKELEQDLLVVYDPREMSENYSEEGIILFDEMTQDKFLEHRKLIAALMITEPDAKTSVYYGSKKVVWPRKVLISTNEDISMWKIDEALKARLIIVNVRKNGEYQYQKFDSEKLVNIENLIEGIKS